ncbi:unnamed protein product, partial [Urochloa humidicola]
VPCLVLFGLPWWLRPPRLAHSSCQKSCATRRRSAMATADALENPAASCYSGRPLNYDPQQAQVVVPTPEPPPQPQPQSAVVDRANAPQRAGEQASNHTQAHGVPGYYVTRLKNANTVAPAPPAAASAPSPAADAAAAPPPVAADQKELSFIDKILKCFKSGKDEK